MGRAMGSEISAVPFLAPLPSRVEGTQRLPRLEPGSAEGLESQQV